MYVLFYRFAFRTGQITELRCLVYEQRYAVPLKIIGNAAASADEHGGRRIRGHMNENAFPRLISGGFPWTRFGNACIPETTRFVVDRLPQFHFMRRLAEC